MSEQGESSNTSNRTIRLEAADLQDAKERANLSLLGRIFWDETRDLRQVERVLCSVWTITALHIIDVGYGLYQFIFPSTSKRSFALRFQPWSYRRHLIHFTEILTPSAELFDALQLMNVWVKLDGLPLACRTTAVGSRLLEPLGELKYVGLFDAGLPGGFYVKGLVWLNLFEPFQGITEVFDEEDNKFPVYFQYINVTCICYRCGYQGHTVSECDRQDLVLDLSARDSWISIPHNKNEHEVKGPRLEMVLSQRQTARRGRGQTHMPPTVQAGLSTTFLRNRARQRGSSTHGRGLGVDTQTTRLLALPGPAGYQSSPTPADSSTESRSRKQGTVHLPPSIHRTPQHPVAPGAIHQQSSSRTSQAKRKLFHEDKGKEKVIETTTSTIKNYRRRSMTLTIREPDESGPHPNNSMQQQDSTQDTASSSARRLLSSDIGTCYEEVNSSAAATLAITTGLGNILNDEAEATGLDWSQPDK
ncbi:hypothetical protein LINGRAHAP2_LOCUS20113 [Linum grandiflorum]